MSSIHSSSPRGDPGSLQSLYTLQYRALNSSLLVWGPTSWMAETSTFGSNFGRPCWQPWQIIHSTSFHPCSVACWNISCRMMGLWGLSTSHPPCPSRNISTSMWCSTSLTDKPSVFAHSLAVRDLLCLSQYVSFSSLWYLKKTRKHYSTWN